MCQHGLVICVLIHPTQHGFAATVTPLAPADYCSVGEGAEAGGLLPDELEKRVLDYELNVWLRQLGRHGRLKAASRKC
jgi:hypothetical protein